MCQEELLMMSQRDRDRLRIIQQVSEGRLSQVDAAEQLGLTARHVRRLVKRLVRRGDGGLIHQSRGKPSHNRFHGNFRQRVLRRYKSRYSDFGPTLAAEKLAEDNMVVADETLRGWLITEGLWQGRSHGERHRARRERKACFGQMIQTDANGTDDAGSIRITSLKTERHHGGGTRLIPLFPELYQPLLDCFELAQPGEEFIIRRQGKSKNFAAPLKKIILHAGLKAWPRLFNNVRSSRISELLKQKAPEYDLAQVAEWAGNLPETIAKHYLQSTNKAEDFKRAAARKEGGPESGPVAAQTATNKKSTESTKPQQTLDQQGICPTLSLHDPRSHATTIVPWGRA